MTGEARDRPAVKPLGAGQRWKPRDAALVTTACNIAIAVIGVGTGVIAARLLGPKGRGELAAIQAWPTALASLGLLGSAEALVYFVSRVQQERGAYLAASLAIGACGAFVCTLFGFLAMPWLLKAQSAQVVLGSRIFLLSIWAYLLIGMPSEVLRGAGRFAAWNAIRVFPALLWLSILCVAWAAGVRRPMVLSTALAILGWLALVPLIPLVRREIERLVRPTLRQVGETLKFGLPAAGAFVPKMMNLKLDQILMAGLMPPVVLGQYVVAVAWSNAGAPFAHGLSSVVVPDIAGRTEARSQGEALARASRTTALIGALIACLLLASARLGIPFFFGARFRAAVRAAQILALAGGLAGFNLVLSEGLRGLGRPVAVLRAELMALAATAAGLWLFLRPYGIVGAAGVSLAAYLLTALWLLVEIRAATGASPADLMLPRATDARLLAVKTGETLASLFGWVVSIPYFRSRASSSRLLKKALKRPVLRALALLGPGKKGPVSPDEIRRLAIFRFGGIGDVIVMTGMLRSVRRIFKKAEITVVTNSASAPVLENNPTLDHLIVQDHFRLGANPRSLRTIAWLRRLSSPGFDLAFFMHNDLEAILPSLFIRARFKVGYDDNGAGFDFPFTHSACIYHGDHPRRAEFNRRHVNACFHDLIRATRVAAVTDSSPQLFVRRSEVDEASVLLGGQSLRKPLVALALGGSNVQKLWPLENFAELAQLCVWRYGYSVIVLGDSQDARRAGEADWPAERCYLAAGRLTLRQSLSCLSLADVAFGADTGLIHAARALGVPTVSAFGPTPVEIFGYVDDRSAVLQATMPCVPCHAPCRLLPPGSGDYAPCMRAIDAQRAIAAISKVIASPPARTALKADCKGLWAKSG
ncbi:MAG TPA: glycosyltransferase family 9 protein [Candidatus Binataceae bacterium]|nr:glycosyltransferase family 9 protein [Candidatus Binataceae bacterium]